MLFGDARVFEHRQVQIFVQDFRGVAGALKMAVDDSGAFWDCPLCTLRNPLNAAYCDVCNYHNPEAGGDREGEVERAAPEEYVVWMCSRCTFMNQLDVRR